MLEKSPNDILKSINFDRIEKSIYLIQLYVS